MPLFEPACFGCDGAFALSRSANNGEISCRRIASKMCALALGADSPVSRCFFSALWAFQFFRLAMPPHTPLHALSGTSLVIIFCCSGPYRSTQILTFDEGGVSGHSDHTAVHRGVALLLRTRASTNNRSSSDRGTGSRSGGPLDAYALVTTGMLRKYSGMLDMPWSLATSYGPPLGAFFSSFSARVAWAAMAAHHSQFVWYRRLFVIFSRYAYVNTFKRMPVPPPPPPSGFPQR